MEKFKEKVGIIGVGNMGSAILKGMVLSGNFELNKIFIYDKLKSKTKIFTKENINPVKNEIEVVKSSDFIILAVKPDKVIDVLLKTKSFFNKEKVLISIAAGVSIKFLMDMVEAECQQVARVMPNIPALIGCGISAIVFGKNVNAENQAKVENILKSIGETVIISEEKIDIVTGLSGSGPAYIFMVIEALKDGGVKMGLDQKTALKLAVETVIGAATLVKQTGEHPDVLKDRVSSPGGTTITAIHVLEKYKLRAGLMEAVETATKKAMELSRLKI